MKIWEVGFCLYGFWCVFLANPKLKKKKIFPFYKSKFSSKIWAMWPSNKIYYLTLTANIAASLLEMSGDLKKRKTDFHQEWNLQNFILAFVNLHTFLYSAEHSNRSQCLTLCYRVSFYSHLHFEVKIGICRAKNCVLWLLCHSHQSQCSKNCCIGKWADFPKF